MKTTRTRIGLITALLAVALAGYWMFLRPPEDPLCKGVPLSEWLERPEWNMGKPPIQPEDLRAIAPKAAPFLAYYLRGNYPRYKQGVAVRMPYWLQAKLPPTWIETKLVGSSEKCRHALQALAWLGADAEPALSTLVMLQNDSGGILGVMPARVIHSIGPTSWPAVLELWHSGSVGARKAIIWEVPHRFRSRAATEAEKKMSIDLLLEACRDPDSWTQYSAIDALKRCRMGGTGSSPQLDPSIPILIRCMEVGSPLAAEAAAHALSQFPEHARTTIPALKKMAGSSNPACSKAAKQALESIEKQKPKGE